MTRKPTVSSDSVAHDQLRAFVERIERLDEEAKSINDDKKEVYAEAKGNGFDTKALKMIIRKRGQDSNERMELEALVELYEAALGMRGAPCDDDEDEGGAEDETKTGTTIATRAPAREDEIEARKPDDKVAAALRTSERRAKVADAAHAAKVDLTNSGVPTQKGIPRPHEGTSDTGSSDANNPGVAAAHINSAVVADQGGEGTDPALSADHISDVSKMVGADTEADASGAPVEPSTSELGDGNGLRLKGEATAKVDSAADVPSVGPRESGSLAAGAFTQREDDASPSLHPTLSHSPDHPADQVSPAASDAGLPNSETREGAPATEGVAPSPSSVVPFTSKPRDGLYSADWLRRHGLCQHSDTCAVTPGRLCRECSEARPVEAGGVSVEHQGQIA